jgi:hypothetical protein
MLLWWVWAPISSPEPKFNTAFFICFPIITEKEMLNMVVLLAIFGQLNTFKS